MVGVIWVITMEHRHLPLLALNDGDLALQGFDELFGSLFGLRTNSERHGGAIFVVADECHDFGRRRGR